MTLNQHQIKFKFCFLVLRFCFAFEIWFRNNNKKRQKRTFLILTSLNYIYLQILNHLLILMTHTHLSTCTFTDMPHPLMQNRITSFACRWDKCWAPPDSTLTILISAFLLIWTKSRGNWIAMAKIPVILSGALTLMRFKRTTYPMSTQELNFQMITCQSCRHKETDGGSDRLHDKTMSGIFDNMNLWMVLSRFNCVVILIGILSSRYVVRCSIVP